MTLGLRWYIFACAYAGEEVLLIQGNLQEGGYVEYDEGIYGERYLHVIFLLYFCC